MQKLEDAGLLFSLMQQMDGTAAQRLSLFEKLKGAGMLACDVAELEETEEYLRSFAAAEKVG